MFLTYGGQYNAYLSDADIVILVGNRGSAKSHTILCKVLSNIGIDGFNGYILRKEIKDAVGAGGIMGASKKLFEPFGTIRESIQSLDWRFFSGATCTFLNYSAPVDDFRQKVQGKEIDFIAIDEVAQMGEDHFSILMANLRSSKNNVKPQIFGTCNPDATSWIKDLIAPYIDFNTEYHTHNPEMNGVKMYFYQTGSSVRDSVFGRTREEVYENAKEEIDKLVLNSGIKDANPLDAILSISCFYLPRAENPYLTKSKGGGMAYEARLAKMTSQEKVYNIWGGWRLLDSSESCLVKVDKFERWINNNPVTTGVKYASMDMSGSGKDKTILNIWDGYHLEQILHTDITDAKALVEWTKRQLVGNGVPISRETFVYDSDGLGWAFSGHFTDDEAFAFHAKASPSSESQVQSFDGKMTRVYRDAKSETIGKFLKVLNDYNGTGECGLSIDQELLYSTLKGKTVKQWLSEEIRGLEWKPNLDGIKQIIPTKDMDAKIGHHSDILISIIYRFALDVGEVIEYEPIDDDDDIWGDLASFAL